MSLLQLTGRDFAHFKLYGGLPISNQLPLIASHTVCEHLESCNAVSHSIVCKFRHFLTLTELFNVLSDKILTTSGYYRFFAYVFTMYINI